MTQPVQFPDVVYVCVLTTDLDWPSDGSTKANCHICHQEIWDDHQHDHMAETGRSVWLCCVQCSIDLAEGSPGPVSITQEAREYLTHVEGIMPWEIDEIIKEFSER